MTEMKRTNDTIEMLQYQLKRYKAMKIGAACQSLQIKLHKLMNQANGLYGSLYETKLKSV